MCLQNSETLRKEKILVSHSNFSVSKHSSSNQHYGYGHALFHQGGMCVHVCRAVEYPLCLITGNSKPVITPTEQDHLVVDLNKPFELHCRGEKEMQWSRERGKVRVQKTVNGMSTLHITKAQPLHMDRYICLEKNSGEQAAIYVYVRGSWM